MSFRSVSAKMAKKQGIPEAEANAELAASTRKSSQRAVNANPKLARVPGTKKPQGFRGRK